MNNSNFLQKIKAFILTHKILSLIILVVIILTSYFIFKGKTSADIKYITNKVTRGDIVVSVSGTGQVEASNSIEINAKASGDITYVPVHVGQEVKRGTLIASIDSRDAKIALENAEISLAKLTKNPDTLTLTQKENSLNKSYSDGWNLASSTILDMTPIVDGIEDLYSDYLGANNVMTTGRSVKDKVNLSEKMYYEARKSLNETTDLYKKLSRTSDKKDIEDLIYKMHDTVKIISSSIKSTQSAFDSVVNSLDDKGVTEVENIQTDLTSWTSEANNYVGDLLSASNTIIENTQSLNDLIAGSDALDIRSAELSVQSKRNSYEDYSIRAPFDGVIASLTAKVGQSASGTIGTLITKQKIVTIPLNEVDIAQIKLNQKAKLSFDAISDLNLEGEVVEIDATGAVSSGVVTYNVKISFDSNDERIKPGMSVSASIITENKSQVLVVPSSAIKTKNGNSFVEMPTIEIGEDGTFIADSSTINKKQKVEIGISDDTNTEIISGLNEGDTIITKTTTNTNSTSSKTTPSILNSMSPSKTSSGSGMGAGVMMGH